MFYFFNLKPPKRGGLFMFPFFLLMEGDVMDPREFGRIDDAIAEAMAEASCGYESLLPF